MILAQSIAIGLILTLFSSEIIGSMAGGLVVPGYIAYILDKPDLLIGTLIASFLTLIFLKIISNFSLLYGRRRLLVTVLLGFLFSELSRFIASSPVGEIAIMIRAFGFIIPGLLAYWMDRQGIIPTLSTLSVVCVIIRYVVILINGGAPVFK
ncbi:MAG: poly-gamma-glutamate biosynthesis protein PgsC [Candidatus Hydrothermales bacterium]